MVFDKLEPIIGENLPECLKKILNFCGYNTMLSLQSISVQIVRGMEQFMNDGPSGCEIIKSLNCCYSETYGAQSEFHFLPGHKAAILALPNIVAEYRNQTQYKIPSHFPFVLRKLIETAEINKYKLRPTYTEAIKSFAAFLFLKCGRSSYEFLCHNLPLPSIQFILKYIDRSKTRIIEGRLRTEELSQYLDKMGTAKSVWLSEDATAIISRVKYDPKTNQMIGLLLPLDKDNGCPIPFSFLATDADTIEKFLKQPMSHSVYLVMAQALDEKVPPFVLQMFGTTQRFTSTDVNKRWLHTQSELRRFNIDIVGISSDGDPKLLSAMRQQIMQPGNELLFVQDPTHTGTKLRNRLLHALVKLTLGNRTASIDDLASLIKSVQKSVHGLTQSDVVPYDRMNFTSFGRIIDDRVLEALRQHIPNSEGTIKYLQICSDVTACFLALDMKPLDRLLRMFRAVFFIRIWRQSIVAHATRRLGDNFISSNAYMCIEVNARTLLLMIKTFRDKNMANKFLPALFDSQTCERSFRLFRSMGTMEFTRINFSFYDLTFMIGRTEVMNDIAYTKFTSDEVVFPNIRRTKSTFHELPSDDEINIVLNTAKQQAVDEANAFGMVYTENIDEFIIDTRTNADIYDDDEACGEGPSYSSNEDHSDSPETDMQDENATEELVYDCPSAFVEVRDENGVERIVRKSTLIWMLTEPSQFLSKDRLNRFKSAKRKATTD